MSECADVKGGESTRTPLFRPTAVVQRFPARAFGPPRSADGEERRTSAIWSVRSERPESKAEPLTTTLAGHVAEPRLYALLLGVFAAIALTLAALEFTA